MSGLLDPIIWAGFLALMAFERMLALGCVAFAANLSDRHWVVFVSKKGPEPIFTLEVAHTRGWRIALVNVAKRRLATDQDQGEWH